MNILYIAYSCSPNHGSEDRIGWKIPMASAKWNQVYVITKEEHRNVIEEYCAHHDIQGIQFFYVDIPPVFKKIFRGPAYSGRLNIWQKRAVALAEQICAKEKIDLIHQITPVEFRSIGDYGKIHNVKFVCGPVGGGEYIPKGLGMYAKGHRLEELVRRLMNCVSLATLKIKGTLERCDALLFANEETKNYLEPITCGGTTESCMTEIGIDSAEIIGKMKEISSQEKCVFLVAGRMVYRKGHELLLDALAGLPDSLDYECKIVGYGPESDKLKRKCEKLGIANHVSFSGRIPFDQMEEVYRNAQILVMPSIRETTGSVILEAMAKGMAVVTIGRFGGSIILDESNAWMYDGNTRSEFIEDLRKVLITCITHPEWVRERGQHACEEAKKHLWDNKATCYQRIYTRLVHNTEE